MISSTFRSLRPIIEALPDKECKFFDARLDILERLRSFLGVKQDSRQIIIPIIADILHTPEEELWNLFGFSFENAIVPMMELDNNLSPSDRKKLFLHIIDEIIANNRISFTLPNWAGERLSNGFYYRPKTEKSSDQEIEEPSE